MSYLTNIREVTKTRMVTLSKSSGGELFPTGKDTYVVFGVGRVENNTSGNNYWDNSANGANIEVIPKNECSQWFDEIRREGSDKNGSFINWLYTGSENDPCHVLGLDNPQKETIAKRRGQAPQWVISQPNKKWIVPVLITNVTKKGKEWNVDVSNGTMVQLMLTDSQFTSILDEAKRHEMDDNPDMRGRVIRFSIDRDNNDPRKMYSFQSMPIVVEDEELFERFDSERLNIVEKIENQINSVHGGEWVDKDASAREVWKTIVELTGMTVEQVITKYYAGPETGSVDVNTSVEGLTLDEEFNLEE